MLAPSLGAPPLHYITWTSVLLKHLCSEQEKRREGRDQRGQLGKQETRALNTCPSAALMSRAP